MSKPNSKKRNENVGKRRVKKRLNEVMQARLRVIFFLILAAFFVIVVRTMYLNSAKGKQYKEIILKQQTYDGKAIPFKRGDITDRNGNILATSVKVYNVVIDAGIITGSDEKDSENRYQYYKPTIQALAECFPQMTEEEFKQVIDSKPESHYIIDNKLRRLSYEQTEKMREILADKKKGKFVKGVWFEEEYKRMYPYNTLASGAIGFTASGNVGITGIEHYYDDYLNGTDGRQYGHVNDDNSMEKIVKKATDGYNLVSTIDLNLQQICEKYVDQWVQEYHPKEVAVVLANPNTGEILAMADNNSIYNLNDPYSLDGYYTQEQQAEMNEQQKLDASNQIWRNFLVSDSYEAGSTIKPFTIAGALEDGKISTDTTFLCDGGEQYATTYIGCHKRSGHGPETLEQALMNSCNDALMQISRMEGIETFTKYQSIFGFGLKSGIDLPGEISCASLLYTADNMTPIDLACNSFGQNFNVNAMQMVAGFSSIVNGGNYYKPHIVKQIESANGGLVKSFDKQLIKQTITKSTSDFLKQAMVNTVESGTGKTAKVEGYVVGGKTGTAQHKDKTDKNYLLSFLGFAPYDKPQVVCYAIVDSPQVEDTSSSSYACRLFSAVMTEVLPYMDVYQTREVPQTETEPAQETTTGETNSAEQETTAPYVPSDDEAYDEGQAIDDSIAESMSQEMDSKKQAAQEQETTQELD